VRPAAGASPYIRLDMRPVSPHPRSRSFHSMQKKTVSAPTSVAKPSDTGMACNLNRAARAGRSGVQSLAGQ
jgi:hypothetical protein